LHEFLPVGGIACQFVSGSVSIARVVDFCGNRVETNRDSPILNAVDVLYGITRGFAMRDPWPESQTKGRVRWKRSGLLEQNNKSRVQAATRGVINWEDLSAPFAAS
jgi:hypothetical protein